MGRRSAGGDRQEASGVGVPVGLAGGDAGLVEGEPLGVGLLGSGVPPDGVGSGVGGGEVGLPDGLGVLVGGGDEGVPVGAGVGRTVGVAVGGLVVGRVAVGFGAPVAGCAVVGSALGRGSDSVWATGTVGGAMSAGVRPETTSAPGVAGSPGVGVAGAGHRCGVPPARAGGVPPARAGGAPPARAGGAPPESVPASPIIAKPTPAPPSSSATRAPVATGSAAERGWRGRRWAGNERS
ncbi:hypothetical protein ACIBTV_04730 [Micromonospora sp. NPDC049366]|uniref:hypothetical protein n=1 Tax=Micromonospora sp. NPDC049366 TaxID=3364271 RepID=UPI0037A91F8A